MMSDIPIIHFVQLLLWLVNNEVRSLCDDIQITVGNNGCNLDYFVLDRVQTGHLKINPDEAFGGHSARV